MTEPIQGMAQLQRRLKALASPQMRKGLMTKLALVGVRYGKLEAPRKTGHLAQSIRYGAITERSAEVVVGGVARVGYAAYVHEGTRAHDIVPRNRKALAWAPGAGDRRLSGSPRSGARRAGRLRFARKVRHPGTRANPFLVRGVTKGLRSEGIADHIVATWNKAR